VPATIALVLLALASLFVWGKVFNTTKDIEAATTCNEPSPQPSSNQRPAGRPAEIRPDQVKPIQPLGHDALDRTEPLPASASRVRVLNGNGQRGQANLISEELGELGFQKAADPTNDPDYPKSDLNCAGQIRFGASGVGAARTLSMIVPCAQLVRDQRQDDTVDLALGKKFDGVKPNAEGKQVLKELDDWAQQQPDQHGGQQAQPNPALVDSALLAKARDVECG
jgi:LytR cell envelope-related transcriptional attenuator